MAADPAGERQVYRGAGAVVLWWAWAIFAVASLAAIAAKYHDHGAAVTATVILAITGIVYACALHPRVVAGPAGISVENPLRTHLVPWSAVTRVDLAQSLQVHYAGPPGRGGERVVHSWAVPGSPRARARRELRAQRESRRGARGGGLRPGARGRPRGHPGLGRRVHRPAARRAAPPGTAGWCGREPWPGAGQLGLGADRRHAGTAAGAGRGRRRLNPPARRG